MKIIYKLCTACLGEGKVEDINPEKMKVTITESKLEEEESEKKEIETCSICKGKGVIPTGAFFFEDGDHMKPPSWLIKQLPEHERKAIINVI